MKLFRDFVSNEDRTYRVRIGHVLASSLSGFVAGVIVASLVFFGGYLLVHFLTIS